MVAIDLSPGMLRFAQARVHESAADLELREMDVQHLEFGLAFFDAVVATFVSCSVPCPVVGLNEFHRVLQPRRKAVPIGARPVAAYVSRPTSPAAPPSGLGSSSAP